MTTTKYSNKIKKLPQELIVPLFRTILNNSFFNFSWGASAEAYMTYFLFNRCTINLCVRPSTNVFDITSPFLESVGIPTFYDFLRSLDGRSGNKETNRFKLTLLSVRRVDPKKEQVQTK